MNFKLIYIICVAILISIGGMYVSKNIKHQQEAKNEEVKYEEVKHDFKIMCIDGIEYLYLKGGPGYNGWVLSPHLKKDGKPYECISSKKENIN